MSRVQPSRELRALASRHRLWRHPLLQRCREARLELADVRTLAAQMYKFSREFNRILASVLVHCPDEPSRVAIAENLFEELGEGDPTRTHPELFRRFTRALGISDEALEVTPAAPGTTRLVETYLDLSRRHGWLPALGAICFASEGIVSVLYTQLLDGISFAVPLPADALIFFDLHIQVDTGHAARLAALVDAKIASAEELEPVRRAVVDALDARAAFFDDIEANTAPSVIEAA